MRPCLQYRRKSGSDAARARSCRCAPGRSGVEPRSRRARTCAYFPSRAIVAITSATWAGAATGIAFPGGLDRSLRPPSSRRSLTLAGRRPCIRTKDNVDPTPFRTLAALGYHQGPNSAGPSPPRPSRTSGCQRGRRLSSRARAARSSSSQVRVSALARAFPFRPSSRVLTTIARRPIGARTTAFRPSMLRRPSVFASS